MKALRPVFDPIDGPYYEVEGERLRTGGFREKTKEKNAQTALQQLLDREITTGRGKTRPDFVLVLWGRNSRTLCLSHRLSSSQWREHAVLALNSKAETRFRGLIQTWFNSSKREWRSGMHSMRTDLPNRTRFGFHRIS